MSSKSKTKTKGEDKGGFMLTLPLKAEHADMLHKILNDGQPMELLPRIRDSKGDLTNQIVSSSVWKFNELRKIVDEQRKPPPGDFDDEQEYTPQAWRKKHDLSANYFHCSEDKPIVFSIPDNVKGVLRYIITSMPNVLPLAVHLKHWEAIIVSWRLTRWVKVHFANKALADPDGEAVDFDDVEEDDAEVDENDEAENEEEVVAEVSNENS